MERAEKNVEALKAFQTELGVRPTGTVNAATIAALQHAIATAEAEVSSSPSATPLSSAPPSGTARPTSRTS